MSILRCEVSGVSATSGIQAGNSCRILGNYIHDSAFSVFAIKLQTNCEAHRNILSNLTGGHGISAQFGGVQAITHNTIHNIGGSGIWLVNNPDPTQLSISGNLFTKCGGYGMASSAPGLPRTAPLSGNAFGGGSAANTYGNNSNLDDDGTTNPVDTFLMYQVASDLTTTGDPYIDAPGGDYRLNDTAGARSGAAVPVGWPNITAQGGLDFGAVQSQPSGGSTIINNLYWIEN